MKRSFLKSFHQKKVVSGLTLVEVMVGMLVSGLFLTTSIQAYVSATAMRTQGGSLKEAIGTAQNDMEFIRDQARSLDVNNVQIQSCASANGQGYGQRLRETIQGQLAGKPLPSGVTSVPAVTPQIITIDKPKPDGSVEYQLTRTLTIPGNSPTLSKDTLILAYDIKDISPDPNGNPRNILVGEFDTAIIPAAALSCP
jgi:Tfp pilus assembly protein PilE